MGLNQHNATRNADPHGNLRSSGLYTCPACAGPKIGGPSRAAHKRPGGLEQKIHFALFVSMCVIGAVAIVDTGPFPLNYAFGAAAALLPLALVIKRRRSGKTAKKP